MHYLEVSLKLSKRSDFDSTALNLKTQLDLDIKELLGTEGAIYKVDILKYEPVKNRFILRCDSNNYVRLRAALTLSRCFEVKQCSYGIQKASPNLLSFTADSRTYKH